MKYSFFNETRKQDQYYTNNPLHNASGCMTKSLTQLSDVVLGDVAREGNGTSEQWCVGSPVIQPEALMLAHLEGRLPRCLYNTAVQHLGVEGRRCRHCNTI